MDKRKSLTMKLIPICDAIHPDEMIDSDEVDSSIQHLCQEFVPSISNNGICLTRNGHPLTSLFRETWHLSNFTRTFVPSNYEYEVANISNKQSEYHFTFMVDESRYNNLKRGKAWNVTAHEKIKIGIHSPQEVADVRGWYNKIIYVTTGFITTIKVKPSQQISEDSIRALPIKQRKCQFSDETEGLISMKTYTKIHCLLDCKMKLAEKICMCRPWDYPNSIDINISANSSTKQSF